MMNLPEPDQRQALVTLLQNILSAIEDLLLTGLAAATRKTRQTLAVSFQAASKQRLLRLGSTLRVAVEELGRFAENDPSFSRRRFSFFLNRSWMLSQGMIMALEHGDAQRWRQLTWRAGGRKIDSLEVVTLGVMKRVVPGAFVAFEFRLRAVGDNHGVADGTPLLWSCVFPLRTAAGVPPEACLHLPLPQQFKPADMLGATTVRLGPVELSDDGRLSLLEDTRLRQRKEGFSDWQRFLGWDRRAALERLRSYTPGPFDLEIELQEEVTLTDWEVGEPEQTDREQLLLFPLATEAATCYCPVDSGDDHQRLRRMLNRLKGRKNKPPLYGVMHYEMCRFMFQPLTLYTPDGPEPVMLNKEKFSRAALVKTLNFT